MSVLEQYSQTVQRQQGKWHYSNSGESQTFKGAIENHNKKTNCALMVSWALKDIGILEKDQKFYKAASKAVYVNGAKENIKKAAKIIKVNKTAKSLIASGELQRGDICLWYGVQHTNVYAGNKKWYDAGRWRANGAKDTEIFETFGPIKIEDLNNSWKVDSIIRLNADTGGDFVAIAKKCHDYVSDNRFSYGGGNSIPIDESGSKVIDCSTFVSWVCYEYGYKDFGGSQTPTSKLLEKASGHNWTIKDGSEAVAGDILLRTGHTEIYAGNGKSYNCGSDESILAEIESCTPSRFTYAITVTPPK